jgi:hypothetical protein
LPNQTVAFTTVLLTENTANNGGPDGTRTRDLRLDRPA